MLEPLEADVAEHGRLSTEHLGHLRPQGDFVGPLLVRDGLGLLLGQGSPSDVGVGQDALGFLHPADGAFVVGTAARPEHGERGVGRQPEPLENLLLGGPGDFDLPPGPTPGEPPAGPLLGVVERGVRYVQCWSGAGQPWDSHDDLEVNHRNLARGWDQPIAGLLTDLQQRGMLDDTLVIWGGEFGRTVYCQGRLTESDYGRDHHPRCFTVWLAGGGVKAGSTYGETDDHSYNIVKDPVEVHDLNATILHCLGIEHTKLTFKYQGRHHRLTDVHGKLVPGILA